MASQKRLAIIGAGPSGLVSLKFAREFLDNWEVICFEQGNSFGGSWAQTHPAFVSTSTKATTQFACFQQYEIGKGTTEEFFLHNEYGAYLNSFVEHFDLGRFIKTGQQVGSIQQRADGDWQLEILDFASSRKRVEQYSHILICTGLANKLKSIESQTSFVEEYDDIESIINKKVVVLGGGESAVDIADRLSEDHRNNKVFLSLRSGIRVSPRIHPIRGVPSDYLRNRLMLSIHEDIRNGVGQGFVNFRIKFERLLQKAFPARKKQDLSSASVQEKKAFWSLKINRAAKGKLFNMFHNKSDDFLSSVAEGRIMVVGPATDDQYKSFFDFDQKERLDLSPDLAINAIGFDSNLDQLTKGTFALSDFYLGCQHRNFDSVFCVGFVRPIIGNIPTIAELQARYAIGQIEGAFERPENINELQRQDLKDLEARYPAINTNRVIPADMFPYCDHLAKLMQIYPKRGAGLRFKDWKNFWLSPASTSQYLTSPNSETVVNQKVFTPILLNFFLCLIKCYDLIYRVFKGSDRN